MEPGLAIHPLGDADRREAVQVLARAFRDNPLNRAVIGEAAPGRRLRANRHGMRALLPVAQSHGCALVGRWRGRLAAALVAAPPLAYPLPPPPLAARLRCLAGQGLRTAQRWSQVFETIAAHHPPEPHTYLATLGVDPELQGRGLGSALLRHWLEQADRWGRPVYLETDRPQNLPFYAREGFAVEGEIPVLGVRVWRMLRPLRG
jgi:GNAT superfamily N-acetyltransferase